MGVEIITTINTAASSYDLTDLATVHDELKIPTSDATQDTFLARIITQVSQTIRQYCNRTFQVETLTDLVYIQQDPYPYETPGGIFPLRLSRWPVTAITSVIQTLSPTTTQTLIQDTDYKLDAINGFLTRLDGLTGGVMKWEALPVTVQYSAGFSTLPADLVDAALRLITARYWSRGRDPSLRQENQPGLGERVYWVGGPPSSGGMPQEIAGIIDQYRVPVIA